MPRIDLFKFIIASVILHVVAFSIWAFVWKPYETITEPQLINFGVLGPFTNGVDGAKGVREPHQMVESKLDNRVVKSVSKKNEEYKITKKQEMKSQPNKSVTELGGVNGSYNTINEQKEVIYDGLTAGIGSFEDGSNMGYEGSMPGVGGSGQGIEVGYPNYKINPKPGYPMIARRNGYEGTVLLRVWVLESGKVGKIEVEKSSGYEILDNSALKAVRDWIFMPGKRNGVAITSWVTVPIKFQLSSG